MAERLTALVVERVEHSEHAHECQKRRPSLPAAGFPGDGPEGPEQGDGLAQDRKTIEEAGAPGVRGPGRGRKEDEGRGQKVLPGHSPGNGRSKERINEETQNQKKDPLLTELGKIPTKDPPQGQATQEPDQKIEKDQRVESRQAEHQ